MRPARLVLAVALATTPVAAGTTTTILPQDTGTIEFLPLQNILHEASIGFDIQSTCSVTTAVNLSFRGGFMEFALPTFPRGVAKAVLFLTDSSGADIPAPLPPDVHEVSFYPADLSVDISDYDAPAVPIGTLETDANDPRARTTRFDVTDAVRQLQGGGLGFRIKLQIDPAGPCPDSAGSEFGSLFFYPPRLEIISRGGPVSPQ